MDRSTLETAAAVLAAIGTVAAVVVALFFPDWQRARRRPTLSLEYDARGEDLATYDRPPFVSAWARFRVRNGRGRDTARKVRVILVSVERTDGGQTGAASDTRAYREFSWSELRQAELDIPADVERRVDIVHVDLQRETLVAADKPWPGTGLGLALWPRKYDERDYLGDGSFIIRPVVAGDNFDGQMWETHVSLFATHTNQPPTAQQLAAVMQVATPVRVVH